MEPLNVAIICYSATGTGYALAQAAAVGAEIGARERVRKVAELAPQTRGCCTSCCTCRFHSLLQ